MPYKKIWINHNGPIPKDDQGRPYEIHHVDGNRKNNLISNLVCISLQDHYNIHFKQQDWDACFLIAKRVGLSKEELDKLRAVGKRKLILECPHCHKKGGAPQMKQWHFENCSILTGTRKKLTRYRCSICNQEVGGRSSLLQHERSHLRPLNTTKLKKTNDSLQCPHCNFIGKPHANLKRYHFDNCPNLTNKKRILSEEHKAKLRKPKSKTI